MERPASERAQVVIRDNGGTDLALGSLEDGYTENEGWVCVFEFTDLDVPAGGGIYSVEVSHRGEISFMEEGPGDVAMTLG